MCCTIELQSFESATSTRANALFLEFYQSTAGGPPEDRHVEMRQSGLNGPPLGPTCRRRWHALYASFHHFQEGKVTQHFLGQRQLA